MKTGIHWLRVGWSLAAILFVFGCQSRPTSKSEIVQYKAVASEQVLAADLENRPLTIAFFAVGQGDCNLVLFPDGKRMLVDCGSSSTNGEYPGDDTVRDWIRGLLPAGDNRIDLVVVTHPDADHFNHLIGVIGPSSGPYFNVGSVLHVGEPSEYVLRKDFSTKLWLDSLPEGRRIAINDYRFNRYPSQKVPTLDGENAWVLAANVRDGDDKNSRSIVIKITQGTYDILLTGDATAVTDRTILDLYANHTEELDVELWKSAHHGAWATATKTKFVNGQQRSLWIDAIKPEAVVYPAPLVSSYGHPDIRLAELLAEYTEPAPKHRLHFYEGKGKDTVSKQRTDAIEVEAQYQTGTNGSIVVEIRNSKPVFKFLSSVH